MRYVILNTILSILPERLVEKCLIIPTFHIGIFFFDLLLGNIQNKYLKCNSKIISETIRTIFYYFKPWKCLWRTGTYKLSINSLGYHKTTQSPKQVSQTNEKHPESNVSSVSSFSRFICLATRLHKCQNKSKRRIRRPVNHHTPLEIQD